MNFLTAQWQNLIMANYAVPPDLLSPHLPPGTTLDVLNGKTYVSLVGFMFLKTRVFGVPVPGMGDFEEINLRFYVLRREGDIVRRGVVFVNETVPSRLVAWVANKLYREHYTAIPTRHSWSEEGPTKEITYGWQVGGRWNHLGVRADTALHPIPPGSQEEFIFEHYFGYTATSGGRSLEYGVGHDRWMIHPVQSFSIDCDFAAMYGTEFAFLGTQDPDSIFLAGGSPIFVKWKRRKLD